MIVPVREEASKVGGLMTRLGRFLRSARWQAEVIVVDDGSEDGTGEAATRWTKFFESLTVVRHGRPQGPGTAARTGALLASGEHLVVVDSRGTLLLDYLEDGADVAIASRRVPGAEIKAGTSFLDRASETTFTALSKLLVPVGVRDASAELKAFRREAGRRIAQRARVCGEAFGYEWLALANRLGLQVVEVPVSALDEISDSRRRRPNELTMLRDVWRLRRRLNQEHAPQAKAAHELLHETRYRRLDRKVLSGGRVGTRRRR
jgi:glycosyltransferase involved in cell wall biosynthesis